MPNPFDGSWIEPRYEPKQVIDPNSGIIWELDPDLGGRGWRDSGLTPVPPEGRPPASSTWIPPHLLAYYNAATPVDEGAIAIASAASLQRTGETHNAVLAERYAQAYRAFLTGKGRPLPNMAGAWAMSNFYDIYTYFTSRGYPVPVPREVNFNI